jgi:hypothetical protein
MLPPRLDVMNQQMHHKVVGVLHAAAILEQKLELLRRKYVAIGGKAENICSF